MKMEQAKQARAKLWDERRKTPQKLRWKRGLDVPKILLKCQLPEDDQELLDSYVLYVSGR